ncbi:MAG: hypothetical protein ACKORB_04420 [Opitutia bacterium]
MRKIMLLIAASCTLTCPAPAQQAPEKPAKKAAAVRTSPRERAEAILLSKVDFVDLRLDVVAAELTSMSAKADPKGEGVKVVYGGPAGEAPSVSMSMTNIRLQQALEILAQSTGCRATPRDGSIVFEPR